jgi:hypothetical protein
LRFVFDGAGPLAPTNNLTNGERKVDAMERTRRNQLRQMTASFRLGCN